MHPGSMALTRMPRSPSTAPNALTSMLTPPLVPQYATCVGDPTWAERELLHHRLDLSRIADVGDDGKAFASNFFDAAQGLGRIIRRAPVDPNQRALAREPDRRGLADPGGGTCDKRDFAGEAL